MDWRKTGELAYEYERAVIWARELDDEKASRNPPTPTQALYRALIRCAQGDTAPIEALLVSEHDFPLTREDRIHLARVLGHKYWARRRLGRRPDSCARLTCGIALRIFRSWKTANKKEGISDWGFSDEMKDQACHYALNIYRSFFHEPREPNLTGAREPIFETVRQLMDRPASRRGAQKSRQKAHPISA